MNTKATISKPISFSSDMHSSSWAISQLIPKQGRLEIEFD